VVTIAPMEAAARKNTGNWMLLGERMRTTSFLFMPRLSKLCASFAT